MRTTRQKTYLTMALLAIILIYSFIDKQLTFFLDLIFYFTFFQGFGHYSSHIESVPTTSDLDGLVIAVKTTLKFHESRICDIIDT
ncbi:unnamed protein product, partial [Onchocerca flexuosa]|uniref:DUF1232 domain-containing protein n=1 Tax=Onchocerca flexuosa TaxID=387005 RepID=A0A183H8T7_9BILA